MAAIRESVAIAALVLLLVGPTGCQFPLGGQTSEEPDGQLPPALERLRKNYADLESGRFVSLGGFEELGEEKLFRVVGPDGSEGDRPQPVISNLRGRRETGAGGLRVHLEKGEQLRLDGERSEERALIRDWRGYSILLVSVYGPSDGVELEFAVESGDAPALRWTQRIAAGPGWNLYRFDAADIADRIDLADVRALSWRLVGERSEAELYLDDLVLADNTMPVLGESASPGELYVYRQGRRIHVGARGRFELAFSDGLITLWNERGFGSPRFLGSAASSARADEAATVLVTTTPPENLTVRTGLGPWPVPLEADWFVDRMAPPVYDDPQAFAHWGASVAASQRLVEASSIRVVLEGRWQFQHPAGSTRAESQPAEHSSHMWRYVIYPSGRVFVRTTSNSASAGWRKPHVGYAIALDGRRGFTRVERGAAPSGERATNFALLSRKGAERADLLWIVHNSAAAARLVELASADERRVALLLGHVDAAPRIDNAHLITVWPADVDAAPEAASIAGDYQNPALPRISVGGRISDAPGDLNADGFNESEGCYELSVRDGLLRFEFDPGRRLRYQPIFRVHGTQGARCWVYADGRILKTSGRDPAGRLLFGLPGVIQTPTAIEVVTQPGGE